MKKNIKPKIYKFTFYGAVHPMDRKNKSLKDLRKEIDDMMWSVSSMQPLSELEVTKHKLKEKKSSAK
tara:strand:+ start:197 stop:397 length:201 start_codon:yes stop_codon:yes gene_type:complete